MNNEEKILQMLEQMNGRLDGIDGRLDGIDGRLDGIDGRLDGIDGRLDGIDDRLDGIDDQMDGFGARLDRIEDDIAEIKEHAEVTRSTTNTLVEWAETVGVITNVKLPLGTAQKG